MKRSVKMAIGWVHRGQTLLILYAIVLIFVMLGSRGDIVLQRAVITACILLIMVISLYIFTGLSGIFSFGHVAFMLVGAYTAGLMTMEPDDKARVLPDLPQFLTDAHLPATSAVILGGVVAAIFAGVLVVPIMRLSGLTLALATFAVLIIVNVVARNWYQITNGMSSFGPVPTTTTRDTAVFWVLVSLAIAMMVQRSRLGLRLRASREDELAALAIGANVVWNRAMAFVISAFVAGIAGALQAQFLSSFTPDAFYLTTTILTITMLVVGGMVSLSGAVVGTIAVSVLAEALRRIEVGVELGPIYVEAPPGLREVGVAALILLILVLRPKGLTGGRELRWPGSPHRQDSRHQGMSAPLSARPIRQVDQRVRETSPQADQPQRPSRSGVDK